VPSELTGVNAMKTEVTANLVQVPCLVRPTQFTQAPLSLFGVPSALQLLLDECGSFILEGREAGGRG